MRVALTSSSLAGLAVFVGWSILVNARDSVERRLAAHLRHPMSRSPEAATSPHPRFVN